MPIRRMGVEDAVDSCADGGIQEEILGTKTNNRLVSTFMTSKQPALLLLMRCQKSPFLISIYDIVWFRKKGFANTIIVG